MRSLTRFPMARIAATTASGGLLFALALATSALGQAPGTAARPAAPTSKGGTAAPTAKGTVAKGAAPASATPGLARYAARDGLALYVEFTGFNDHAAAWQATSAYKMLNVAGGAGPILEEVGAQLADKAIAGLPALAKAANKPTGAEVVSIAKHLAHSGFLIASNVKAKANPAAPTHDVIVVRGAGKGEAKPLFDKVVALMTGDTKTQQVTRAGRKVTVVAKAPSGNWAWWLEKDDLVIAPSSADDVDVIAEALDGKRPNATAHPLRAELLKPEPGFVPAAAAFLDLAVMPQGAAVAGAAASAVDLGGAKRIDYRWGFQDAALLSITRIAAPKPRKGMLATFDQATFNAKTLPPIPKTFVEEKQKTDINDFTVAEVNPKAIYEQVLSVAKLVNPPMAQQLETFEKFVKERSQNHKLKFREDILAHLGPKMAFYVFPQPPAPADKNGQMASTKGTRRPRVGMPGMPGMSSGYPGPGGMNSGMAGYRPSNAGGGSNSAYAQASRGMAGMYAGMMGGGTSSATAPPTPGTESIQIPRFALVFETDNAKAISKAMDELRPAINKEMEDALTPPPPTQEEIEEGASKQKPKNLKFPVVNMQLQANPRLYVLFLPPPLSTMTNMKLAIAVGKKYVVISAESKLAREVLALEDNPAKAWTPNAQQAALLNGLGNNLVYLKVDDPGPKLPKTLVNLPEELQSAQELLASLTSPAAGEAAAGADEMEGRGPGAAYPGMRRGRGASGYPGAGGGYPGASNMGLQRPGMSGGGASGFAATAAPSSGGYPGSGGASGYPGMAMGGGDGGAPGAIDPAKAPKAATLKTFLFPGLAAATVDDREIRIVRRSAFPNFSFLSQMSTWSKSVESLQNFLQGSGGPGGQFGGDGESDLPGSSRRSGGGGGVSASRPD